jgi:hypothetical protein
MLFSQGGLESLERSQTRAVRPWGNQPELCEKNLMEMLRQGGWI